MTTTSRHHSRPRPYYLAALAAVAVALISVAAPASASAAPPASPVITDIVDAFLVDGENKGQGQPWFCMPKNVNPEGDASPYGPPYQEPDTKCTVGSYQAAATLIYVYATNLQQTQPNANGNHEQRPGDAVPAFMRAGKARNDCVEADPSNCVTGVPEAAPAGSCPGFWAYTKDTNPYCALDWFSHTAKIKLGNVISASTNEGGDGSRSVRNIAFQACQIEKDDTTNLYSFVFLDFSRVLTLEQRRNVVNLIQRGQVLNGAGNPTACKANAQGYPVMTNDQQYENVGAGELATNAWAHAKDIQILREPGGVQERLNDKDPLEPSDNRFVEDVDRLDSQAVLRFEVTAQTGELANLARGTQCDLLGWLARYQRGGYSLIYPTFVHGSFNNKDNDNPPYDSFANDSQWSAESTNTFGLQSTLLSSYPGSTANPPSNCS